MNLIGTITLYKREVWRFAKVWNQTIFAPVVTTMLFFAVLTIAINRGRTNIQGLSFPQFISAGLIMMAILQNSFANTSSSLMLSKIQGVIIDILMPPLKGWEITLAMMFGSITRGLIVCISVSLAMFLFSKFTIQAPMLALLYVILSASFMGLLGILGGIMAETFDQMSAFTNYIITPLSFLSGTFYSINRLPEIWQNISKFNPFFYMIDGFRYSLTGYNDGNIIIGLVMLIVINITLFVLIQYLLDKGYRLKY